MTEEPKRSLIAVPGMTWDQLKPWHPTITEVREAILRFLVMTTQVPEGMLPADIMALAPDQNKIEEIAECCAKAVRAGRLIDFGKWTNEVIKQGGLRGSPLYSRAAIGHPFREPYVFRHTWEQGTCVYLVNPLERDTAHGQCECIELEPIKAGNLGTLQISDQLLLGSDADGDWTKHQATAIPNVKRFLPGSEAMNNGMHPARAAGGNILDPLMTALMILSTRGIMRETVTASDKLQNARRKSGKQPIPPYDRVDSAPYVTAIQTRMASGRGGHQGGTHASPIPHLRMGHLRTLPSGTQTFVRDALVNMTEETRRAWISGRSHYDVKGAA